MRDDLRCSDHRILSIGSSFSLEREPSINITVFVDASEFDRILHLPPELPAIREVNADARHAFGRPCICNFAKQANYERRKYRTETPRHGDSP